MSEELPGSCTTCTWQGISLSGLCPLAEAPRPDDFSIRSVSCDSVSTLAFSASADLPKHYANLRIRQAHCPPIRQGRVCPRSVVPIPLRARYPPFSFMACCTTDFDIATTSCRDAAPLTCVPRPVLSFDPLSR